MTDESALSVEEIKKKLYEVLGMVGHDISTPITVMDQYLNLFLDGLLGSLDPRQKQALEVMKNHSDRLKKILADVERITSWDDVWRDAKKSTEKFDIQDCLAEVVDELKALFESKRQTVCWRRASKPVVVQAHRDSVRVVFLHLLVNAFKFTPEGSRVVVEIKDSPGEITVTVEDNGKGLCPETLRKIFDCFYIGKETLEFSQGVPKHISSRLGLGLPICRQIVESHGGRMWAESESGKFFRCCFVLPKTLVVSH